MPFMITSKGSRTLFSLSDRFRQGKQTSDKQRMNLFVLDSVSVKGFSDTEELVAHSPFDEQETMEAIGSLLDSEHLRVTQVFGRL